jgi:hypothetical protein
MKFNLEDKLDYIDYLSNEIKNTKEKQETIFTNHYLVNLQEDLRNIKNNLK